MTKIALVDDSKLDRTLLIPWINQYEDCKVISEAPNGKAFLEAIEPSNLPDLVLLDLNMPVMDGFDTAQRLLTKYPNIKALVLTSLDSEIAMIRVLKLGVGGFVEKGEISAGELKEAIDTIMETGYFYRGSKLIPYIQGLDSKTPSVNNRVVTEVEMRFLRLACSGETYRSIAMEMKVSIRTVDGYRDSLFSKLNVASRVELALFAVKHGFVRL